jgi:hypothetical protein
MPAIQTRLRTGAYQPTRAGFNRPLTLTTRYDNFTTVKKKADLRHSNRPTRRANEENF